LRAVAQGQLRLDVQLAGLLHHLEQVGDGDLAEDVAGAAGVAHVAADGGAVGPGDPGGGLAGGGGGGLFGLPSFVGVAPAQDGGVGHGCFRLVRGSVAVAALGSDAGSPAPTSIQVQYSSPMSSSTVNVSRGVGAGAGCPESCMTSRCPSTASAICWR